MTNSDVRATAEALFRALEERRWQDAAALLHPESIAALHRRAISLLDRDLARNFTVEKMREQSPDMPLEVAEYQVRRLQERMRAGGWITRGLAGVQTPEEVRALSPVALATRAIEASDLRVLVETHKGSCAPGSACATEGPH